MREVFERFEAEANACLENGLILPAHDYVLKCSHTFNILDTRGAIGVAERQGYFRRMRELARRVAVAYLEQRKELEYPLLKDDGGRQKDESKFTVFTPILHPFDTAQGKPSSFILEIGTEELPYGDVEDQLRQIRERVPAWLDELRLDHGPVRVEATPRRATVYVESLSPGQPDREDLVKGPPADKAIVGYDSVGHESVGHASSVTHSGSEASHAKSMTYTQAAIGFARKNGVNVEDLIVREENGGKYVYAIVKTKGRPAPEVLAEALPGLVAGISFTKSMRWNESGVAFSRPIRWFVALLGETVIPFEYAGVVSGNVTRGLRPYDSPEIEIHSADKYFDLIREAGIVIDGEERKALIVEQVKQAAASIKGEAIIDDKLLDEVTNLVEKPTAVLGSFNEEYLTLPREVLVAVMKKHQRYFPIESLSGASGTSAVEAPRTLLPYFIAIRNGDDQHLDIVRQGNEHVLNARFADANFFVREDLKQPLEYYRAGLKSLVFQAKQGTMWDKSLRISILSSDVAEMIGCSEIERANAVKAGQLAKADLTTQMVVEMTSLQGIMGREYALRSGVSEGIAIAIGEQYETVPKTKIGLAVALADRLDSLVSLFAVGLTPSSAKDPFGLRRAAIGVVQPLIEHNINFDLTKGIKKAAALPLEKASDEVQAQVLDFITGRLSVLLKESYRYDVVDAVLAEQSANPASAARAVEQLQAWVERDDWDTILPGYARCVRIIRSASVSSPELPEINEQLLVEPSEKALYQAIQSKVHSQPSTVDELLSIVVELIPSINKFFDEVLVMAEDEAVRGNRLALVGQVANLSHGIADLGKLEGF
jgi:glycyl-tRNA synthetase